MNERNDIADKLDELAVLFELEGENPFKIRAHSNAARILRDYGGSLGLFLEQAKAGEIRGIGANLIEKIETLRQTNNTPELVQLQKKFPPELLEILRIPGLGPKKLKVLHQKLKVKRIEDLEKACGEGKVAKIPGFGAKTQAAILSGIARIKTYADQFLCHVARQQALAFVHYLKESAQIDKIEIAGSLRRGKELVHDVDLLAVSDRPAAIMQVFLSYPEIHAVSARGETKSSVLLKSGLPVDLRVVAEDEFASALQYFTGNKDHNIELRRLAQSKGLTLNEYGLFEGDTARKLKDEIALYRALGLDFIPPEAREAMGEIDVAKGSFPTLIVEKDLKGIIHVHSTYSDGKTSLKEMAQAVKGLGYEYLGISDHSRSSTYAGGLSIERVKRQQEEIDELNHLLHPFVIFKGIECDILKEGELDYPDEILESFDFVIVSVHSRFGLAQKEMTKRIVRAMQHPCTTIVAHLTGRLLLEREGYEVEVEAILETAAKYRVAIEINANPRRLDLDWRQVRKAKEKGILIPINPDAHSIADLSNVEHGVRIARKGWLTKQDVLNALSRTEIAQYFKTKRK